MVKLKLRRGATRPLHEQIGAALRQKIEAEKLKAGETFPSERELAETLGVSRMTVRQALQRLRQEGLIYHERGVGTFVAQKKLDVHTRNLNGFSEEMRSLGMRPSSRLIKLVSETASSQTAQDLNIAAGEKVFRLERLRLADDEPMAFEETYLPEHLCPGLDEINLMDESLYNVLTSRYNLRMHHAAEILEASAASKIMARELGIKAGAPVLLVHRIVYTESNQALESAYTAYRADRYRATFQLTKNF